MVDKHSPRGTDRDEHGALGDVREALDADSHGALKADPSNEDAKLDIGLDESFPTSDTPSQVHAGSNEPAPSSGYDEAAEQAILRRRARTQALVDALPWIGAAVAVLAAGVFATRWMRRD
ncbi:hypothetical protein [Sphingomonas sp. PR090111-T3T-6A]|uniref:hypothetical protein n=1 Tax=Sphingomonas sp. PR090111-T3T-6A TaxID=685778 RepID=UPI00036B9B21|nr:hypothetical protein [Sphingomonas sp. PR090111-T3T-6A]